VEFAGPLVVVGALYVCFSKPMTCSLLPLYCVRGMQATGCFLTPTTQVEKQRLMQPNYVVVIFKILFVK